MEEAVLEFGLGLEHGEAVLDAAAGGAGARHERGLRGLVDEVEEGFAAGEGVGGDGVGGGVGGAVSQGGALDEEGRWGGGREVG